MNTFTEIFRQLFVQSFSQVYDFFIQRGPAIVFSLAVMAIGWVCAVLIRKIVTKLLRAFGFDVLCQKTGFKKFLEKGEVYRAPASIVGWFFYWLILINALIMAQDAMDLNVTVRFMKGVILFIPNIIVVVILLALGFYIGGFASKIAAKTAKLTNVPFPNIIGISVRYIIVGAAIMMALDYISVSTAIAINSFLILFVIIPISFVLILIFGGRDVLVKMMDGRFLREMLKPGDKVEVDSISGEIESIGPTTTKLKAGGQEIFIPNSELARKIIRRQPHKNGDSALF